MQELQLSPQIQSKLKDTLRPEEEVQWAGSCQPFPLVCAENKAPMIIRWILSALVAAALSIVYAVWIGNSGGQYNVIVELIILVACVYVAVLMPVLDRRTLMRDAAYFVTNKRVIVLMGDRPAIALNRAGLNMKVVDGPNGCSHVLLGAAINIKPRKYRITTILPPADKEGIAPTGAVFYQIKKGSLPDDFLPLV